MGLKLDENSCLKPSKGRALVPPPGAYNPNYKKNTTTDPAFSMRPKHTTLRTLNVPGPGTYATLQSRMGGPRYGFGTGPQTDMKINTLSPGPGSYRLPSTISNLPAFAMPN